MSFGTLPPMRARARSVVRMLTTAGPTRSASSVKSGSSRVACASTGAGAAAPRASVTAASTASAGRRRSDSRTRMSQLPLNETWNIGQRSRFNAAAKRCSVANGTSPTTVTHQSPCCCISVWVAPSAACTGRCLSA
jgi:hypothetical protein